MSTANLTSSRKAPFKNVKVLIITSIYSLPFLLDNNVKFKNCPPTSLPIWYIIGSFCDHMSFIEIIQNLTFYFKLYHNLNFSYNYTQNWTITYNYKHNMCTHIMFVYTYTLCVHAHNARRQVWIFIKALHNLSVHSSMRVQILFMNLTH